MIANTQTSDNTGIRRTWCVFVFTAAGESSDRDTIDGKDETKGL